MTTNRHPPDGTALILSGGGARAAYQVGVLLAIARLLPRDASLPFPIVCGTSAGAINAAALAAGAGHFRPAVHALAAMWQRLQPDDVYRGDLLPLFQSAGHWLLALLLGGMGDRNPRSLLDNQPLRALLQKVLPLDAVAAQLNAGVLQALAITVLGYATGQSVTFFQGAPALQPWLRAKRIGVRAEIGLEHLLASSAIPLVFPAERINREYFGDGSVRQMAPLSPAIHLGARRILVIGVAPTGDAGPPRQRSLHYPSLAQVSGQLFNSIFLDSMESDLERIVRINKTVGLLRPEQLAAAGLALRPIEVMSIAPSQPLERLAMPYRHAFPVGMRFLLGGLGAFRRQGSVIASYLLFCGEYAHELITLGYQDAMAKQSELRNFLNATPAKSQLQ